MALRLAMRRSAARLINGGDRVSKPIPSGRAGYFTDFRHTVSIYTQPNGKEFRCHLDEFPLNQGRVDENMDNPFKVTGPLGWYEVRRLDDGMFVRLEMPGVDKEDVGVKMEDGKLQITAKGKRQSPNSEDGNPRGYHCQIDFPTGLFMEKNISYDVKNGVLRVVLPNMNNGGK